METGGWLGELSSWNQSAPEQEQSCKRKPARKTMTVELTQLLNVINPSHLISHRHQ